MTRATSLRVARVAAGFRLLDASQYAGLREAQLSRVERGEALITRRRLDRLAKLYDVDLEVLLGREPLVVRGRPPRVGA